MTSTPPSRQPTFAAGLANSQAIVDRNRQHPGLVDLRLPASPPIASLAIVGSGLMGRSIAQIAADSGIHVSLIDPSESARQIAQAQFESSEGVVVTNDYAEISTADLVIEAVVETLPVKQTVHQKIEAAVSRQCMIASNSSSIPVDGMKGHFRYPDRFCGIHFCHPEVMSLVEVIGGEQTSPETVAAAVRFVQQLGKMPIAIADGAGFVVNRLLAAMLNQALRLFSDGYRVQDVDAAMRAFGFQAGPFEIIDIIGADTCMYAGRTMWEHRLQCVSLLPVMPRLVKQGRLGRKSGKGFYQYPDPRGDAIVDPDLDPLLAAYQKARPEKQASTGPTTQSPGDCEPTPAEDDVIEIALQILAPVVLEASRILEQSIVADLRDIDLAFTHGLSFPAERGGLLHWADEVGVDAIVSVLERLQAVDPRMQATTTLLSMRESGGTFYGTLTF